MEALHLHPVMTPEDRRPRAQVVAELHVSVDQRQGDEVAGPVRLLLAVQEDAAVREGAEFELQLFWGKDSG